MTRLCLVRHGETIWNAEGRIQGHLDVELSDNGKAQAEMTALRLLSIPLDAVYSSDLSRAWATAELIVGQRELPVIRLETLREAQLGEWQGRTAAELAELFPLEYESYRQDPIQNRPPGGERLENVIARCREFLDMVAEKHQQSQVLVVAHGGSIRGVICAAFGLPPRFYQRIRLDNAGLTTVELQGERPVLIGLNDTCHLRGGYLEVRATDEE